MISTDGSTLVAKTAGTLITSPDIVRSGRLIRIGRLRNEWYEEVLDPPYVIQSIRSACAPVDVFTFVQRPPDVVPRFPYHMEWDDVAAIPISSFEDWWNHQVAKKVRKNIRRSKKSGVVVSCVPFDDALVSGIQRIYDEVPIRGGRPFKHYKDDLATCRRKHETYLNRSIFIAAHFKGELIGFIKIVFTGRTARTMQNISMVKYRHMSPANAMLAKAVEICASKGISYLVYGKLAYGKKGNDGLEEFKLANGFVRTEFPRYYVPFTALGKLAIALRLYRDVTEFLPKSMVQRVRSLRNSWYAWRHRKAMPIAEAAAPPSTNES